MDSVRFRFSVPTYLGRGIVCLGFLALICFAQTRAPSGAHSPASAAAKFKAIWEPVNYPEDVPLTDVFFVNANVGWVSGGSTGAGVILNTQDGGDHWTVQWGDPHGADTKAMGFFFLDATTFLFRRLLASRSQIMKSCEPRMGAGRIHGPV